MLMLLETTIIVLKTELINGRRYLNIIWISANMGVKSS
jgi:hypothetical protein